MHLTISHNGIALIKQFEGFRARAYQDVVGKWTIGYGHLIRAFEMAKYINAALTEAEASALLLSDVATAEIYLNGVLPALNQSQFDALCSFIFNLGLGAFEKSTLLMLCKQGKYDAAANEFKRWSFAGNVRSAGLMRRRLAERDLFLGVLKNGN
jgi:GH24 family phage-related lysozyme (muramidase)